jgi:hypothetical protein
MNQDKER